MHKRLLTIVVVLLVGFSTVFLLPRSATRSPSGIALALPEFVGGWFGEDAAVTPAEIAGLGPETTFARKLYTSGAGDRIYVSIVMSGSDMATSIHRPERCLPAQGWTVVNSEVRRIPLRDGKVLATTRLRNARTLQAAENQRLYNLDYYWFVGYGHSTPSHLQRTLIDMRDRIVAGVDQRWAYVTVTAIVTDRFIAPQRTEAQTDALLQAFIKDLIRQLSGPDGKPIPV